MKVDTVLQTSIVLVCCVVALHVGRMCIHGDIKPMQFFGFHSRSHVTPLAEIVHDPPFAQLAGSSGIGTSKGPSNGSAAVSVVTGARREQDVPSADSMSTTLGPKSYCLGDFGMSTPVIMENGTEQPNPLASGTRMWQAPEVAQSNCGSRAGDLFALGLTLHDVAIGRLHRCAEHSLSYILLSSALDLLHACACACFGQNVNKAVSFVAMIIGFFLSCYCTIVSFEICAICAARAS